MTNKELIEKLLEYPLDANCSLLGGGLIEVDAINPKGPQCCIWIQPEGTRVMAEINFEEKLRHDAIDSNEGEEWKDA